MWKTIVGSAALMVLISGGLGSAVRAEAKPATIRFAPTKITLPTAERNWRDWFSCSGACGRSAVSREPVNIPRNVKVQADGSKSVNSLLFTIEGMPGTWPGLKIATP